MPKSLPIIAAVLAGLAFSGCASPWTTVKPASTGLTTPATTQTPRRCDPRQIEDLLAELRQSGAIDPAAEEQLAEDLRQSDPSIWPLVVEQCRATQAYRRQAMKRTGIPESAGRLPSPGGAAMAPAESSQEAYPSTLTPPCEYQVTQASYATPSPGEWRQRLNGAIEALEDETPPSPTTPAELTQHARLRLLYLAAGRREDAERPIPDVAPATQEFLSKELAGLGTWLDAEQAPDPVCRTVEAKVALTEALAKLGEAAPLLVRNATFCTEVLSFGCIKRFDKCEFFQDQNVLLYAELENFTSEPIEKGFRTSLRSGYQIVDRLGQPVVWHEFAPMQDHCKNARRDFFIAYHVRLPKQIAPGKYMLRLLIQDTTRQKSGQASIEFTVKEGKAEGGKGKGEKETKTQPVVACDQDSNAASV